MGSRSDCILPAGRISMGSLGPRCLAQRVVQPGDAAHPVIVDRLCCAGEAKGGSRRHLPMHLQVSTDDLYMCDCPRASLASTHSLRYTRQHLTISKTGSNKTVTTGIGGLVCWSHMSL